MGSAAVIISALGGFGGIAAVISSIAAFRKSKGAEESADRASMTGRVMLEQFTPNHGSSLRDRVDGIENSISSLQSSMKLLGEEVSLIASTMDQVNNLLRDRLAAHDRELRDVKDLIDEKCKERSAA